MQAGRLDRRVTIEQVSRANDTFGDPIETWTVLDTVWADVRPIRGSEPFQGEQFQARADTRFRMRYRSDVDAAMRLRYRGDLYGIVSILELGRQEGLEILAFARGV